MKKVQKTLKELIFDTVRATPRTISIKDVLNFKNDDVAAEERRVIRHLDRVLK